MNWLTEEELKSVVVSWQQLPIHIQYFRDLMTDKQLDIQTIKLEVDASSTGIGVPMKNVIKHHLALRHLGFSNDHIDDYVTDKGLTSITLVMEELVKRILAKDALEKNPTVKEHCRTPKIKQLSKKGLRPKPCGLLCNKRLWRSRKSLTGWLTYYAHLKCREEQKTLPRGG